MIKVWQVAKVKTCRRFAGARTAQVDVVSTCASACTRTAFTKDGGVDHA